MNDNEKYYNTTEYYDTIADISVATNEAISNLNLAKEKVQLALQMIYRAKKQNGNTPISFVSNVTTNDVHHNLLFFELLLNQTFGVINTLTFQELLELTNYSINEEELQ
jgi:hypothetical protein